MGCAENGDVATMTLLARIFVGAAVGLGASALLWVHEFSDSSLAANPLLAADVALLTLGGAVAAVAHSLLRPLARRGLVQDYLAWGLVSAVGFAFLGARELLISGSVAGLIGASALGFGGGLGGRMTMRYLINRLSD
jgi:hypothetical protein